MMAKELEIIGSELKYYYCGEYKIILIFVNEKSIEISVLRKTS